MADQHYLVESERKELEKRKTATGRVKTERNMDNRGVTDAGEKGENPKQKRCKGGGNIWIVERWNTCEKQYCPPYARTGDNKREESWTRLCHGKNGEKNSEIRRITSIRRIKKGSAE